MIDGTKGPGSVQKNDDDDLGNGEKEKEMEVECVEIQEKQVRDCSKWQDPKVQNHLNLKDWEKIGEIVTGVSDGRKYSKAEYKDILRSDRTFEP